MKRIVSCILIFAALLGFTWVLTACGGTENTPCTLCTDNDADGKCDTCGETVAFLPCDTCVDTDGDGKCDRCLNDVKTEEPELFDREKAIAAMDRAIERVRENIDKFSEEFPATCSTDFKYPTQERFNWESGMLTGMYWLAYEYTGDEEFRKAAEKQIKVYKEHALTGEWLNDHDTGFIYTPSCVAGYKITGDKSIRQAALNAADILMEHYDWDNHFIIRSGKRDPNRYSSYRTLVDSMMNIPLFFFAYEETGNRKYYDAAVAHYRTTLTYLVRDDGSSFHHYQFDPVSGRPVKGVTLQGYSDDSCWTRGHSWLIYGFPIAYSYTENEEIPDHHKRIADYYLDRLPSDNIPYWDLVFTEGSDQPRDTSAAAITICGFLEMAKYLEDDDPYKRDFLETAADQMNALIDNYENHGDADGLILGVTHALPQGQGIEECGIYADYFYMEALMRYINPDWVRYW